mgnify:CR=1 FL=1
MMSQEANTASSDTATSSTSMWDTLKKVAAPLALVAVGGVVVVVAMRMFDGPKKSRKRVRFSLPKRTKSGKLKTSTLQDAWDRKFVKRMFGTFDNVTRIYREFARVSDCLGQTNVFWTRANFNSVVAAVNFPQSTREADVSLLFKAIDDENSGKISFSSFLHSLGLATSGTKHEEAKFLVRLLDPERSGFVTEEAVSRYVLCCCCHCCCCRRIYLFAACLKPRHATFTHVCHSQCAGISAFRVRCSRHFPQKHHRSTQKISSPLVKWKLTQRHYSHG